MKVEFKWEVGDVVKMPYFDNEELTDTTILARKYIEDEFGGEIWYETDLMSMGIEFTQTQIANHNE